MNPFENISAENLHHAYLIIGGLDESRGQVLDFLRSIGVTMAANPDARHEKYDTFTKELAGDLALSVAQKSFGENNYRGASSAGKKIFIIETNIITEEAQNALLKVFEEPTAGTHFFILMPQDILLPTLRSRMQVVSVSRVTLDTRILDIKIADRLAMVKEITDGISDEEKTKQDAVALLNEIENELYQNGVEKSDDDLALCQKTREALYDRGAPVKMILENLMISLG